MENCNFVSRFSLSSASHPWETEDRVSENEPDRETNIKKSEVVSIRTMDKWSFTIFSVSCLAYEIPSSVFLKSDGVQFYYY